MLDGTLARGGDVRNDPYWTLDAGDVSIVVRWSGLIVPFLMAGGAPNKRGTAVASEAAPLLSIASMGRAELAMTPTKQR